MNNGEILTYLLRATIRTNAPTFETVREVVNGRVKILEK